MWPVPSVPWRIAVAGAVLLSAFAAGWYVNGTRWQAKQDALRAAYARQALDMAAQARELQDSAIKKAQEAERGYQASLAKIEADAAARPARIVRVRCPAAVPAPGAGPAGDPGESDAAAADRPRVGPDAGPGVVELDASALVRIVDEAKRVSARLRALQGVCR